MADGMIQVGDTMYVRPDDVLSVKYESYDASELTGGVEMVEYTDWTRILTLKSPRTEYERRVQVNVVRFLVCIFWRPVGIGADGRWVTIFDGLDEEEAVYHTQRLVKAYWPAPEWTEWVDVPDATYAQPMKETGDDHKD